MNQVVYNPIPLDLFTSGKDRIILREATDKSRYTIGISSKNEEGYYAYVGSLTLDTKLQAENRFKELKEKLS